MIARGSFEVNLQPQDITVQGKGGAQLQRRSIAKTFNGDLAGHSQGEMLSAMTAVQGSAGYVAIEQVEGTLEGRRGTFILQHYGILSQGEQRLVLEVVPGSGTGELSHLSGTMTIRIVNGEHLYELNYSLG